MEALATVVGLEYSAEALEQLRQLAERFVEEEEQELKTQVEDFQEKQKQLKTLRKQISEKEDLKDKLTIVGLTRRPGSSGRTWASC